MSDFDYFTRSEIEDGSWGVYGWDIYPPSSVLAGQPRKRLVEYFDTEDAAVAAYPDSTPSSKWTEPQVSVPHCPPSDWSHYDAGEYWGEDDY